MVPRNLDNRGCTVYRSRRDLYYSFDISAYFVITEFDIKRVDCSTNIVVKRKVEICSTYPEYLDRSNFNRKHIEGMILST